MPTLNGRPETCIIGASVSLGGRVRVPMVTCRRVSAGTHRAAHAAHEMVALDLRPTYHVRYENVAQFIDDPFGWFIWVLELPDIWATAAMEEGVAAVARAAIADALEVPADAFDLDTRMGARPGIVVGR